MKKTTLSESKTRLQVICSNELVSKLDKYASQMGVTRSALACMFIAQGLMGFDKAISVVDKLGDDLSDSLKAMIEKE